MLVYTAFHVLCHLDFEIKTNISNQFFVPKKWYKKISQIEAIFALTSKNMLDSIESAEILKSIGEKLYIARLNYMGPEGKKRSLGKKGISLRDLASVAKVKHTQIEAIEKGKSNSTILTLLAIASVLDVDLCELLNTRLKHKA